MAAAVKLSSRAPRAERIAVEYCKEIGEDPFERIQYSHPKGYAVACYAERYKIIAMQVEQRLAMDRSIARIKE